MVFSFGTSKKLENVLAEILSLVLTGGSRHSMECPRNISWLLIHEMIMTMKVMSEGSKQGN